MTFSFLAGMQRLAGIFLVLALLAGCAATSPQSASGDQQISDPIEPVNRLFFAVNETLDTFILRPTAFVYKNAVPSPVQDAVRNFLRWLRSPVVIANSLLQGDTENAGNAARQFLVNGLTVGLIDWGDGLGWGYRDEDFGQTLGVRGVPDGPYLVLPIIGPSNGRDIIGRVVDIFFDPLTYIVSGPGARNAVTAGRTGGEAIDFRASNYDQINSLQTSSVDFYARVRSIYQQSRESEIHNGDVPEPEQAADGSDAFENYEPPAPPASVTGALPAN